MASLRNLAIGIHRQNGHTNIAAALRRTGRYPPATPHNPRTGLTNPDTRSLLKDPDFTPTSSSWLNQAERWFGLLTDKQLRRGVHKSVHALEKDTAAASTHQPNSVTKQVS